MNVLGPLLRYPQHGALLRRALLALGVDYRQNNTKTTTPITRSESESGSAFV